VAKLPTAISGSQLRRALERVGFVMNRQRGSHMIMHRLNPKVRVVVPNHRSLKPGTLHHILNEAGLSIDQLFGLL